MSWATQTELSGKMGETSEVMSTPTDLGGDELDDEADGAVAYSANISEQPSIDIERAVEENLTETAGKDQQRADQWGKGMRQKTCQTEQTQRRSVRSRVHSWSVNG